MHRLLLRVDGRPADRLHHHLPRGVAREAEVHGRIDERLHHQEHVGRPRAADGGGHVEELLLLDEELPAQGGDDGPRLLPLLLGNLRRRRPDGHPLADLRRRVRHGAHDAPMPQAGGNRGDGRPGHDGDDQRARLYGAAQLRQHRRQHLRLDRQHDDVRLPRRGQVVQRGPDPELAAHRVQPLPVAVARDDPVRLHVVPRQQTADHGRRHRPGPYESHVQVTQHVLRHACSPERPFPRRPIRRGLSILVALDGPARPHPGRRHPGGDPAPELDPLAAPALILGANAPDIDAVTMFVSRDLSLGFRRGWTHGVLAMVVLPIVLTLLLLLLDRALARAGADGSRGRGRVPCWRSARWPSSRIRCSTG